MAYGVINPATAGGFSAHPEYLARIEGWRILWHAYHGTGGFADGGYIVGHAREYLDWNQPNPQVPGAKLKLRRQLARHENIAAQILNAKRAALFRKPPTRTIGNPGYSTLLETFWSNVDGKHTHIDDWMPDAWSPAALLGHAAIAFDFETKGTTAADDTPYLCLYDATCISDWALDDRGRVVEVRLLEGAPRRSVKDPQPTRTISRIANATAIEVQDGQSVKRIPHPLGRLPIVFLAGQRIPQSSLVGASAVGDAKSFVDHFNLISENREILRLASYPILNVSIGDASIEQVKSWLGDTTGIQHVMFTPQPAQLIEPDGKSVEAYQAERAALLRNIFRLAGVMWESDSKDAESAEALRLKQDAQNAMLAGYADECQRAEYEIVELLFRYRFGPDAWQRELEAAQISIVYPDQFDVTSFDELITRAHDAIGLELGPSFTAEQKKRLARELLPDADPALVDTINKEIEGGQTRPPARVEAMLRAFDGTRKSPAA